MLTLRQLRRIVRGHPDWTSDQIEEELVRTLYTPPRVESLESAFLWVQNQMILLIESQPPEVFSEVERRWFVERLRRVQLELPPPAKIYADAADLFTKNEVYFERTPRGTLRLRVGGGYLLSVSSWFNQVYTLAHELAHSIDPCEAHGFSKKPAAYDSLIQCFVERKWVDPERSNCGQQEQVSEVFADWIAAEILAAALRDKGAQYSPEQTLQAVVNSVIDLCERPAGVDRLILGHHQSPRVRIGQIFAGHPTLQRRMKCPVRPSRYCAFTSTKGVKSP